jgi:hypothetical protein
LAKPEANPYKLPNGNGLYLLVNTNGYKLWRWKYRVEGKEKLIALGAYPDVPLKAAREKLTTTALYPMAVNGGKAGRAIKTPAMWSTPANA